MRMNTGGKAWIAGSFSALAIAIAGAVAIHYEPAANPYVAYFDAMGHRWTICYGHTSGVKQGDTADEALCRQYMAQDMPVAYRAVDRCITAALTVTQTAAFTDGAYNEGQKIVCGSTLQRLANSGHVIEACHQLPRWIWAGSAKRRGLELRRGDETDLCTDGLK